MTSVKAFNTLMQQFLDELSRVFPKDVRLKTYAAQFPMLCQANIRKPMEVFMEAYSGQQEKVRNKDETLFDAVPTLFNGNIDVKSMWALCDAPTKEAIWKYLQHLMFMATTVSLIPPDMLAMIESVAQDCAQKFEDGKMDPSQVFNMLPQLLETMGAPGLPSTK